MNANDAIFSRVFATTTGGLVPDPTPNESDGLASTTFDLVVQAEAGHVIGGSGADYTLHVVAHDLTTGANEPLLGVPPVGQSFLDPPWTPSGHDFVSVQVFPQQVRALAGHVFRYTASLVSKNGQVVAIEQSELFILI